LQERRRRQHATLPPACDVKEGLGGNHTSHTTGTEEGTEDGVADGLCEAPSSLPQASSFQVVAVLQRKATGMDTAMIKVAEGASSQPRRRSFWFCNFLTQTLISMSPFSTEKIVKVAFLIIGFRFYQR
jgi:hypothetical protein